MLKRSYKRILEFRNRYSFILHWSAQANLHLLESLETLYRDSQEFASTCIENLVQVSMLQMKLVPDI